MADRTSGDAIEVWNTATRQREFGPLSALNVLSRWFGFLKAPGRLVVSDTSYGNVGTVFRTYDVGRPDPVSVVDLGKQGRIEDVSGDGTVAAYSFAGVLHLDPAVWRADLCIALGGRDLTADERATMPVAADGPVCR